MLSTSSDDSKEYFQLIKRFPLRPIRSDEENLLAAEICDSLTDRFTLLSTAAKGYLEVLSELIVR